MAPIDINNQEISSITLNGNTDINIVEVNGQEVFSAGAGQAGVFLFVAENGVGIQRYETSTPGFFSSSDFSDTESVFTAQGITLSADGTTMYYVSSTDLFQADLSTPFDARTRSNDTQILTNDSYGIGGGVTFVDGGTRCYVSRGNSSDGQYVEYSLTNAYDIASGASETDRFNVPDSGGHTSCLEFNPDGTRMYYGMRAGTADLHFQYDLGTPFDATTRSNQFTFNTGIEDGIGLRFEPSGQYYYTSHHSPDEVNRWECTTPFDISTASFDATIGDNGAFGTGTRTPCNGLFISGPAYY